MADLLTWARDATGNVDGEPRPLLLGAVLAGAVSAVSVLLACLAVGVAGWFASGASDRAGSADALRVGADAWLLGQGSCISDLAAAHITVVPLGLTALCAWVVPADRAMGAARLGGAGLAWRFAVRGGDGRGLRRGGRGHRGAGRLHRQVHPRPSAAFAGGFVLAFLGRRSRSGLRPGPVPALPAARAGGAPSLPARPRPCCWWWRPRRCCSPAGCSAASVPPRTCCPGCTPTPPVRCSTPWWWPGWRPTRCCSPAATCSAPASPVGAGTLVSPTAVVARPGARVPAARRAARRRPGPVAGRCWSWACRCWRPRWPRCSMLRRHPVRGYETGAVRGWPPGSAAGCCSPCWSPWPAARSGPAGWPSGRRAPRCCRPLRWSLGLGGVSAGCSAPGGQRRRCLAAAVRPAAAGSVACAACPRPCPAGRRAWSCSSPGAGTNLQALLDACADPAYGAEVVAVGADRDGIEGLDRAERAGVPTFVHRVKDYATRDGLGRGAHRRRARRTSRTWWCSAGFMKLAGADVPGRVRRPVRQHPPGAAAVLPGHARAARRAGATASRSPARRCSSSTRRRHRSDRRAGRGAGRRTTTTRRPLHERIKVAERAMLVDTVGRMAREGFTRHRQEGPVRPVT